MDPNGFVTITLVNRFTDKIEYSWARNKWISPSRHLQYCYENQATIQAQFKRRRGPKAKMRYH